MKTKVIVMCVLAAVLAIGSAAQAGLVNYALEFSTPAAKYVDMGTPSDFRNLGQGSYTLEAWIKTSTAGRQVILGNWSWGYGAWVMELHSSGNLRTYVNNYGYNSTAVVADGEWHHVASARDLNAGTVSMYVDGEEIYSVSGGGSAFTGPSSSRTGIGANPDGSGYELYFNGAIDEVRIWNVARTEGQIAAGMHQELSGPETNLVSYYNFNAGAGTTLADNSAAANTGSLINNPLWVAGPDTVIPEPATICLLGIGGLFLRRRKRA